MNVSKIEHHAILQLYSPLNDWINYIFIVPIEAANSAFNIIQSAFDDWNSLDTSITVSDYITAELSASDITCEVYMSA